jgi:PAS domain S-box-containing protein
MLIRNAVFSISETRRGNGVTFMEIGIFIGLLKNIELLLIVIILYQLNSYLGLKFGKIHPILKGSVIGLIGMFLMTFPYVFQDGLVFDARSILIASVALFFSTPTLLISSTIMIVFRYFMGGVGMVTGIFVITNTTLIGLLWRRYFLNSKALPFWLNIYLYGLLVHAAMLLTMYTLPAPLAQNVVSILGTPILLLYPVVTMVISILLLIQKKYDESFELIKDAQQMYSSLFNNQHTVMMVIDPKDGKIVDANPAAVNFYGWTKDELLEKKISEINTLSSDQIRTEMEKTKQLKKTNFMFKHRKANGKIIDVEIFSGPITIGKRQLLYSIVVDISARVLAEAEMKRNMDLFRTVVENVPVPIFIHQNGRFAFMNPAALTFFGASVDDDLINTPFTRFVPTQDVEEITQNMNRVYIDKSEISLHQRQFIRMDGKTVFAEVGAIPLSYDGVDSAMIFARDLTMQLEMQEKQMHWEMQIQQKQRLESIGILAGGVAHEINNPINGIMNYAQLIVDNDHADSKIENYGNSIIRESNRISDIVRSLLQFSRFEKNAHSYSSVYDIIDNTLSLIKVIFLKDHIELNVSLEKNLPDMKCRSQQIQQVFMNLMTNARDALNEKYPGYHENKIIEVDVRQMFHDERRWIYLSVKDYGMGMSDVVKDRIFEPFYSTKPKDKGTGLGLSISFGIVTDHHGTIEIDSIEGEYSVFTVVLPVDNGWHLT